MTSHHSGGERRRGSLKPISSTKFEARDAHGHCVFVYDASRGVVETLRKGVFSEFVLPPMNTGGEK